MGDLLKRYRLLFENFDEGIVITEIIGDGHDFRIKDLNHIPGIFAAERKDEIIEKKLSTVFPCVEKLGLISKMREVYYTEKNKEYPLSYYEDNDLQKIYNFTIIKLDNNEVAVKYRDLTEEKIRKNRLKENKNRLALAVEGADLGVWDWNIKTGEVKFNDKWAEMLGYKKEELDSNIETWKNLLHEKDKNEIFSKLDEHFEGKTDIYEAESRLKTKDGDYKWIKDIGKVVERNNDLEPKRAVGIHMDIDERKRMERKLKEQKAYFDQLFAESTEGIILLDNDGNVLKVSNHFEKLFGYKEEEILGENIDDLILPPEIANKGEGYTQKVANGGDVKTEGIRQKKNGEKIHVSLHAFPITLKEGQLGIYTIYNDISQRKKEEEKIRYLSFHDQMTGLYNRRYFENEMERLSNSRMKPVSIIVADIDDLKLINDNFGHKIGDEYIKTAAEVIESAIRKEDIAARIGGDEFAIILPYTKKETAEKIINRINNICEKKESQLNIDLEISVGCATCHNEEDLDEIFVEADQVMYSKKKNKI
ncbi:MAG: diguanylate cyclase [Bacillota bacterium]